MKISNHKMPDVSNLHQELGNTHSIEINGGRVIFDQKVTLMPVDLTELPAELQSVNR